MDYTVNGRSQIRSGNRLPHAAPHGAFPCQSIKIQTPFGEQDEGRWCVIACFSDEQWASLRAALGDPEWARDERFATLAGRKEHEDELERQIEAWTSQRSWRRCKRPVCLQPSSRTPATAWRATRTFASGSIMST